MVLRLHDLPPGYRIGDDTGCGEFGTEGAEPGFEKFVREHRPEGCGFQYERIYKASGHWPNPRLVESLVISTKSEAAAEAGGKVAPELLHFLTGVEDLTAVPPPIAIGDTTWLFHSDDSLVEGRPREPGSLLLWRDGPLLAGVYVAGHRFATADQMATQLARIQQGHVEAPTPYTLAEQDDTEVFLDDPSIPIPVYWLGRSFKPRKGFPRIELEEAVTGQSVGPPGEKVKIVYLGAVSLDSWSRAGWKRLRKTSWKELLRKWDCTRSQRIRIESGSAEIFAAYAKDFEVCPQKPPNRFYAIVHLGQTVVGINLALCEICFSPEGGPYASIAGMKTIVRGLRIRPRPQP